MTIFDLLDAKQFYFLDFTLSGPQLLEVIRNYRLSDDLLDSSSHEIITVGTRKEVAREEARERAEHRRLLRNKRAARPALR